MYRKTKADKKKKELFQKNEILLKEKEIVEKKKFNETIEIKEMAEKERQRKISHKIKQIEHNLYAHNISNKVLRESKLSENDIDESRQPEVS